MSISVSLDRVEIERAKGGGGESAPQLEFWARCTFEDACASVLSFSSKGLSRPWRNVFFKIPSSNVHKDTLDSEQQIITETFGSSRYWLKDTVDLRPLNEASLTVVANSKGLCIEIFHGRKSTEDADATSSVVSTMLSLDAVILGQRISRELFLEGESEGHKTTFRFTVDIEPDDEVVQYAVRSRLLELEEFTVVSVPTAFIKDLIETVRPQKDEIVNDQDDEQKKDANVASGKAEPSITMTLEGFTEEELDMLATATTEAAREICISVELPLPCGNREEQDQKLEKVQQDSYNIGEETHEAPVANSKSLRGGNEDSTFEPSTSEIITTTEQSSLIKFTLPAKLLSFDKSQRKWTLKENNTEILSSHSKTKFYFRVKNFADIEGKMLWTDCKAKLMLSCEKVVEDAVAKDPEASGDINSLVCLPINLHALLQPNVSSVSTSSNDGSLAVRLRSSKPLARFLSGEPLEQLQITSLGPRVQSSKLPSSSSTLASCKATEDIQEYFESTRSSKLTKDDIRLLLLSSINHETGLKVCETTRIEHKSMTLLTQLQTLGSVEKSSSYRLQRLAEEAELQGQFSRARELWCECSTRVDPKMYEEFAHFTARMGALGQALELINRAPTMTRAPSTTSCIASPANNCVSPARFLDSNGSLQLDEFISQYSSNTSGISAKLLSLFLRFELGDRDAVAFPTSIIQSMAPETDNDEGVVQGSAEVFLTLAEELAKLKLAECTKKALMCAHLNAETPFIDELLVRSEMVRAQHKIMIGLPKVAVNILQHACKEDENICQANVSEVIRAKAYLMLGEALNSVMEHSKARSVLSTAMSILNELEERGFSVRDKLWTPQIPSLRLRISFHIGQLTSAAGDWRKARVIYRNAVRAAPALGTLSWAWQGLGRACMHLRDFAEADIALRKSLIADPENPVSWGLFAVKQLSAGPMSAPAEIEHAIQQALLSGLCDQDLLNSLNAEDARVEDRVNLIQNCLAN